MSGSLDRGLGHDEPATLLARVRLLSNYGFARGKTGGSREGPERRIWRDEEIALGGPLQFFVLI
jgi:hypothetical protein